MAKKRSQSEPSLFFAGRTPLDDEHSLISTIRKRLGFESSRSHQDWIQALDSTLSLAKSHATIFVDGINENRNIPVLGKALSYFLHLVKNTRIRFVITCRDIYWGFFEGDSWTRLPAVMLRGELYEFTSDEHERALQVYLDHYRIVVEFGKDARERCKHPLLLRFFCEAYHKPTGEVAELGKVAEIRLKPLFDDYWENKMKQIRDSASPGRGASPEECLFALVRHMIEARTASVETNVFATVTGVHDMHSYESLYMRLLDEDIILEELPTDAVLSRRIVFVYEEFMEYTIAKELFSRCISAGGRSAAEVFRHLKSLVADFVNALGVGEYICAFCLDDRLFKAALDCVSDMSQSGGSWDEIVGNVFLKYDASIEMLLSLEFDVLDGRAADIRAILDSLGRRSPRALAEVCAAIGFWLLFPNLIGLDDIRRGKLPPADFSRFLPGVIESGRSGGVVILKAIASAIVKYRVNPVRVGYWRSIAGLRKGDAVECRIIVRALWNLIGGSPRKAMLVTYACNGLFSESVEIRRVAALLTREATSRLAQDIRAAARERETDSEVRELLDS